MILEQGQDKIKNTRTKIYFIDLEKAFDLANWDSMKILGVDWKENSKYQKQKKKIQKGKREKQKG